MNQPIENLPKISERLSTLYQQRVTVAINLRTHERKIDERKLEITPEKWPGSNSDERSLNERRAYAADKAITDLQISIDRYQVELDKIDGEIQAREAERRAGEHIVYAMMADALSGIRNRSTAPAIGRAAVQDAAKHATAEELKEEIARHVNEGAGEQVVFQEGGAIPGLVHGNQQAMSLSSVPVVDDDDLPF